MTMLFIFHSFQSLNLLLKKLLLNIIFQLKLRNSLTRAVRSGFPTRLIISSPKIERKSWKTSTASTPFSERRERENKVSLSCWSQKIKSLQFLSVSTRRQKVWCFTGDGLVPEKKKLTTAVTGLIWCKKKRLAV